MNTIARTVVPCLATLLVAVAGASFSAPALAADAPKALEQALSAMQSDKRGVTLHVNGQAIGGAITKVDGGVVEMRGPQGVKIVVRMDRIDGVTLP